MRKPQPTIRYRRRSSQRRRTSSRRGGFILLLVLLSLGAVGVVLGAKAWRIAERAQTFRHHAQALATFRPTPNDNAATLDQLSLRLRMTHSSALDLRQEIQPFLPLAQGLGWLPSYGADIAAAEPLLDTVLHVTSGLDQAVVGITPLILAHNETGTLSITMVAAYLPTARPHLQHARQSLIAANDALMKVDVDSLSPTVREQVEPLVPMLPLLDIALNAALVGSENVNAILPAFTAWQQTQKVDNNLILYLHRARPAIEELRQTLAQTTNRLELVPIDQLPASLRVQVEYAMPLLPIADALLELVLAVENLSIPLAPLVADQPQKESLGVALVQQLLVARPQLEHLHDRMVHLQTILDTTAPMTLAPAMRPRVQHWQHMVSRGLVLTQLSLVAPDLLGIHSSRDYLLIALNPDELRAAGGLMSATGIATINHGYMEDLWMKDSSLVDSERLSNGPYIAPPEPLRHYMGLPQWGLWDAGWSPDFRYSASAARYLYNLGHDPDVADVVAFTPQALEYLLTATGPLMVAGTDTLVSADNVLEYMRTQYDEVGLSSESFLEPLLDALFAKVVNDLDRPNPFALAEMVGRALDERHMQILIADAPTANLLHTLGWDGAVRHDAGDFLMVVDSNVSYSKSNASIKQAITYTVDLRAPATTRATLDIHYAHTSNDPMECWHYKPSPWSDYERSYVGQMNRCYWDYLRVLVAPGSIPQTTTRNPTPANWLLSNEADAGATTVSRGENGTTQLSTLLVVPSGGQRSMSYGYGLPVGVLSQKSATGDSDKNVWQYHLRVQKQAGREPIPLVVQVMLPEGAVVVATSHPPSNQQLHSITFALDLATDVTLDVAFQ